MASGDRDGVRVARGVCQARLEWGRLGRSPGDRGAAGSIGVDGDGEGNLAAWSKIQGDVDLFADLRETAQAHQHQVIAAWLEHQGLTGCEDGFQRAASAVVLHGHDLPGQGGPPAQQPYLRLSRVCQGEVENTVLCTGQAFAKLSPLDADAGGGGHRLGRSAIGLTGVCLGSAGT